MRSMWWVGLRQVEEIFFHYVQNYSYTYDIKPCQPSTALNLVTNQLLQV